VPRIAIISISCLIAALTASSCGTRNDMTPIACLEGESVYLQALKRAPETVKLRDETPIGECLVDNQKAGDLATVGTALVGTATKLNAQARAEPGGEANLQLGYLLGAAERGGSQTDGIHAELIRRLTAAARYSPDNRPLPPAFLHAYREGFDAGEAHG
jgi:hypothetical protein